VRQPISWEKTQGVFVIYFSAMKRFVYVCVLAFSFSVFAQVSGSNQTVVVHKLTLSGASKLSEAERARITQYVQSQRYKVGKLQEVSERLRYAFQERGYFKAMVSNPVFVVLSESPTQQLVDATISVDEGQQYRLSDIQFKGATAFPSDDLRAQFPISSGESFNVSKIKDGLDAMRRLYCAKGFVNFTPVPDVSIDDTTRLISLTIDVDEGPIFQTGKLTIQGIGSVPGGNEKLLTAWKAYEGSTYNCDVLDRFLREIHASPAVKPNDVFKLSVDNNSRVVNVEITLAKPLN
jgi:hemolysin activation/secretion protein